MQSLERACWLHAAAAHGLMTLEGSSSGVAIGALNCQEVPQVLLLLAGLRSPLCPRLRVALFDEVFRLRQLYCKDKNPCAS